MNSSISNITRLGLSHIKEKKEQRYLQIFSMNIKIKLKGFKGFIIINSVNDSQETIALTFRETKEDMDTYHKLNNKWFNIITDRIKPLFEQLP